MCNPLFELSRLSAEQPDVQQQLREAFNLSNTDVDITLLEVTAREEHGLYFDRRLEWNQVVIRRRWNPYWNSFEEYTVKEPKSRDLGRHQQRYQIPESK